MDYSTDTALCLCADGDMKALEWLYIQLYKYVCAVCYSVTGDYELSSDAAQDTFARLPDAARSYKPGTNAKAFIFKVAYNAARENRRKFGKRKTPEIKESDLGRTEKAMLESSYISELLSHLDKKRRTALVMHVYGGLTYEEIAVSLGIHKNTAAKYVISAKEIIKERMKGS